VVYSELQPLLLSVPRPLVVFLVLQPLLLLVVVSMVRQILRGRASLVLQLQLPQHRMGMDMELQRPVPLVLRLHRLPCMHRLPLAR